MHRQSENALVFMAKWPHPGRAKTRLCPPLTPAEAADLARAFLLDTLAEASHAGADLFLAFAPLSAAQDFRRLVGPDVGLIPAEAAHLGIALREGQRATLALGYRRVALVGSDLPHLTAARYGEAFDALAGADAVIGPSGDGGYYLLAAERETPALFEDITWSTSVVFKQTQARAVAARMRLAEIAPCDDVDTACDLLPLWDALRHCPGAGHTVRLLERLPLSPNPSQPNPQPPSLRGKGALIGHGESFAPALGLGRRQAVYTNMHRAEVPPLAGEGPVSEASGERSAQERGRP